MKPIALTLALKFDEAGSFAWMQTRSEEGPLDGFLEFPGGKIEPQEEPLAAARREFHEETGYDLANAHLQLFNIYRYQYDDRDVLLHVFLTLAPVDFESNAGQWILLSEELIEDKRLLQANRTLIKDVLAYLKTQQPLWQAYEEGKWPK